MVLLYNQQAYSVTQGLKNKCFLSGKEKQKIRLCKSLEKDTQYEEDIIQEMAERRWLRDVKEAEIIATPSKYKMGCYAQEKHKGYFCETKVREHIMKDAE